MAVAHPPAHASDAMASGQRRIVYGLNVAVTIILACGVLTLAVYLSTRFRTQLDVTRSGINSLSPRTVQLVRKLDQNVTITALYTVLSEYDTLAQKRQRRVGDLLNLYESVAPTRITASVIDPMKDSTRLTVIRDRLVKLPAYQNEAAPHKAALESLPAFQEALTALLKAELDAMGRVAPEFRVEKFDVVEDNFRLMAAETRGEFERIDARLKGEIPAYGEAVEALRAYLPKLQTTLNGLTAWMQRAATGLPPTASPDAKQFYNTAGTRYADVLGRIQKLLDDTKDLKRVKLEDLYTKIRNWPNAPVIIVETAQEARVLDFYEVWPSRRDGSTDNDGDRQEFAGERCVSSAILQLSQKEKTAVVFVRYGGPALLKPDMSQMNPMMMRQMPSAPYQQVSRSLEDAGFVIREWDAQTEKTVPKIEDAARTVYVVVRPEDAPPQNPMMQQRPQGISPADKQLILDAVNASGRALFLTGWRPAPSPMPQIPMSGGAPYAFSDYLQSTWGVAIKSDYLTFSFVPSPENPALWVPRRGATALVTLTKPEQLVYGEHEITEPIQSLTTVLMNLAPLEAKSPPGGVKLAPLLSVAPSDDIWAISDQSAAQEEYSKNHGLKPNEKDLKARDGGFPVAIAAENDKGQRAVVISSETFAVDDVAFRSGLVPTGNTLAIMNLNPGNIELFLNALHWLAGNADRIAAGPASSDVPRLSRLREGASAQFCRIFLVGIWPALALVAGGAVWLFRRR